MNEEEILGLTVLESSEDNSYETPRKNKPEYMDNMAYDFLKHDYSMNSCHHQIPPCEGCTKIFGNQPTLT